MNVQQGSGARGSVTSDCFQVSVTRRKKNLVCFRKRCGNILEKKKERKKKQHINCNASVVLLYFN